VTLPPISVQQVSGGSPGAGGHRYAVTQTFRITTRVEKLEAAAAVGSLLERGRR
jgi:hypothetical protein